MKWEEILKADEDIEKFGIQWDGNAKNYYSSILNEIPHAEKKKLFKRLVTEHWKRHKQPITIDQLNSIKSQAMGQYGSGQISRPTQTAPDYGKYLDKP